MLRIDDIHILWLRQMRRYFRSRSRIFGAIGQPLLFLLALGYGVGSVYKQAGQGDYLQFLVPGIVTQTILFSGVFWGIQILFDKRFGFLVEMLVAPVSRVRILLGNALGGATISFMQAILVFVISMILGFRTTWTLLPLTIILMVVMSLALTSFGAGIASMVEDFQGFQAINNFIIFPLFFLSSALYPLTAVPAALKFLATINPLSYFVDALRYSMIQTHHFNLGLDLLVIIVSTIACIFFAVNRFNKIQT
jgi:ABC-2 type transport system permease protein